MYMREIHIKRKNKEENIQLREIYIERGEVTSTSP